MSIPLDQPEIQDNIPIPGGDIINKDNPVYRVFSMYTGYSDPKADLPPASAPVAAPASIGSGPDVRNSD